MLVYYYVRLIRSWGRSRKTFLLQLSLLPSEEKNKHKEPRDGSRCEAERLFRSMITAHP